jgi:hypothetical protein
MKKLISLCFVLLSLTLQHNAQAATVYGIEVLIFSRDNASAYSEYWPTPDKPPASGISLSSGGYNERSARSFMLKSTDKRIRNTSGLRVIYHKAWTQSVRKGRSSKPVAIRAGSVMDDGYYELEGAITVDRGHYLHFKPDLQLRRTVTLEDGFQKTIAAVLDEPRRMKSKEAHYIDHPLFGILVYATPLN